jgi:hypothetical protein
VSPERAAFHLERARRLTAALDEIAALEALLPPHKTPTLLVSLRVLRQELARPSDRTSTPVSAMMWICIDGSLR